MWNVDYKKMLESIPGAVMIDLSGKVVYMNKQCASYMKVNLEDAIGKHIHEVFPKSKMMESLDIDAPQFKFYNSFGIGISVHVPVYDEGKKIGIMEYDIIQSSEFLYDFASDYEKYIDSQLMKLTSEAMKGKKTKYVIDNIIGNSPQIVKLKKQIRTAAKTNATVIVFGETGTGKEMVAHSIHSMSRRFDKPFIKFNAANIPDSLVESELFGYEKGAFTGALKNGNKGKFESANGGTIYMDEINQMSLSTQTKLLRVLQEKEIERIGGTKSIPIDVRVIVTTNEDLKTMVEEKRFREDLFYRLNVITIVVPPLRERVEDIPILAKHFLERFCKQQGKNITELSEGVLNVLRNCRWPGNIRELENVIERAVSFSDGGEITVEDIKDIIGIEAATETVDKIIVGRNRLTDAMDKVEKKIIEEALEEFGGNKSKVAEYLGISRTILYKKIKKHEIIIN